MLPREHGAWGILLLPFLAAAVLCRTWNLDLSISLLTLLTAFIVREPLTVLARQRWVWRDVRPESALARQALAWEVPLLTACGIFLWLRLPRLPLLGLAAMGLVMTAVAIWMTLKNRQRSSILQIASAFGLSSTALLAALAGVHSIPPWAWVLWLVMSLYSFVGILVVHVRLDLRVRREGDTRQPRSAWIAYATVALMVVLGVVTGTISRYQGWEITGFVMSFLIGVGLIASGIELYRLTKPDAAQERLQQVGWRMMRASVFYAAFVVYVLWPFMAGHHIP